MADLSRQARLPNIVMSTDAAYCYDCVNCIIMSLVWLVLTNGNIPAIVAALICLQMMKFFSKDRLWRIENIVWRPISLSLHDGLGQGNRAAPPSWIQLSAVLVNVFKQLNLGTLIQDPVTAEVIHSMGTLFVDDTDLYTWRENILDPGNLWCQAQLELEHWSCLLNATGGALKPDKCFGYLLDYVCKDGQWTYAEMVPRKMLITNLDGTKSPINQVNVTESKKTLGIHDLLSGGNAAHLSSIKAKVSIWVNRMMNGHLPNHTAWIAYKHQL
jgi:hypothetical protein